MVEASRRRLLRSSADGRGRDPPRHHDRRRHRTRRPAGVDPAGAADELGFVSRRRDPVRRRARGGECDDPAQRHADGGGRHLDRHAGCAAIGGLELRAVFSREGAGDRTRRVVACGRRGGRRGAAVEIYRAVFRPGDPDLAGLRSQIAALAALALALSRRPRRAGAVFAGHALECRSPLGLLHQADRPRQDRGLSPDLHRRIDSDPDRIRNAIGMDPRRDGALRAVQAQRRRARRARAGQFDILDHRAVFHLAFAARPRRGQLVRAGLSGLRDRRGGRRPSHAVGGDAGSASPIFACAGPRRSAS